ncbi:MAG: hypothetical protein WD601_05350 [Pseudohongiellaceae bacterium]
MAKVQTPPEQYHVGFLSSLDARTAIAQSLLQRYKALTDDLGGSVQLSYAQKCLAERALFIEFWIQQQEQALAAGSDFDAGKWTQAVNSLQGLLSKLGLHRVARDVSLTEYLKRREDG